MTKSQRALLSHAIDYAGLFPPASLTLAESLQTFIRGLDSPGKWMLGRFVCPAEMLKEASSQWPEAMGPLPTACLLTGGSTVDTFRASLNDDLLRVRDVGDALRVDMVEARVPAELTESGDYSPLIALSAAALSGGEAVRGVCWELPRDAALADEDAWTAAVLKAADVFRLAAIDGFSIGLKLRTGGPTPQTVPSPGAMARFIQVCRDARLPWKATAGLHQPFRHYDDALHAHAHGFVNLFVATVVAHAQNLSATDIARILEDEEPASFAFDDAGLRWREYHADIEQVGLARRMQLMSFGSCSFDDPRDSLREFGWFSPRDDVSFSPVDSFVLLCENRDMLTARDYAKDRRILLDYLITFPRATLRSKAGFAFGCTVLAAALMFAIKAASFTWSCVAAVALTSLVFTWYLLNRSLTEWRRLTKAERLVTVDEILALEYISPEEAATLRSRIEELFARQAAP